MLSQITSDWYVHKPCEITILIQFVANGFSHFYNLGPRFFFFCCKRRRKASSSGSLTGFEVSNNPNDGIGMAEFEGCC